MYRWRVDVVGLNGNTLFYFDTYEEAETFARLIFRGRTTDTIGVTIFPNEKP